MCWILTISLPLNGEGHNYADESHDQVITESTPACKYVWHTKLSYPLHISYTVLKQQQ